jgi:hypothetical protein
MAFDERIDRALIDQLTFADHHERCGDHGQHRPG